MTRLFAIVWLSLFALSGCFSQSNIKPIACDTKSKQVKPVWVPGGMQAPGYLIGVGSAAYNGDMGESLIVATKRARADLGAAIRSHVSQTVSSRLSVNKTNKRERVDEESHILTQATTQMMLDNVKRVASWQDSDTCELWVLVQLEEAELESRFAKARSQRLLKQAEKLFSDANDNNYSLAKRIDAMEEAQQLLDGIDFGLLPSHKQSLYQGRYASRFNALMAQVKQHETLLLINSASPAGAMLKPDLASLITQQVSATWLKQHYDCQQLSVCLSVARQARAKRMLLVSYVAQTQLGVMGSDRGIVEITATAYDVDSGRELAELVKGRGETFAFDGRIEWRQAMQRALAMASIQSLLTNKWRK